MTASSGQPSHGQATPAPLKTLPTTGTYRPLLSPDHVSRRSESRPAIDWLNSPTQMMHRPAAHRVGQP